MSSLYLYLFVGTSLVSIIHCSSLVKQSAIECANSQFHGNHYQEAKDVCGCSDYQSRYCSEYQTCECVRPARCSPTRVARQEVGNVTKAEKLDEGDDQGNDDCEPQPACQTCCADLCKYPGFCNWGGTCVYLQETCTEEPCCPTPTCIRGAPSCDLACIAQLGYRCRLIKERNCEDDATCICSYCSDSADIGMKFCS